MNLFFLRHAIAEDAELAALKNVADKDRKLTSDGKERMKQAASGFKFIVPELDIIAYSPYVRTRQTAKILHKHYPEVNFVELDLLAPGHSTANFFSWLDAQSTSKSICVIGHNPELSDCLNQSVNIMPSALQLKKAGLAHVIFSNSVAKGEGQLELYLTPGYLRRIGEKQSPNKQSI